LQLTPLEESLFIIDWLSEHIHSTMESFNAQPVRDEWVGQQLMKYSWLQICVIMQEWEKLEGQGRDDAYLRNTLKMASPCIRELRRWTGMHKLRNTVIAHFGRDEDGVFEPYWRRLTGLKFPTTNRDMSFLIALTLTAGKVIQARYPKEIQRVKQILFTDRQKHVSAMFNHDLSIKSKAELEARQTPIWAKLEEMARAVFIEEGRPLA